jgi:hypothetical protein
MTTVKTTRNLPGLVSLYHLGQELKNPMAALHDVLVPGKPLVIRFDKSIDVAGGGIGYGAWSEGQNATAGGGAGTGGSFRSGILRGGRGIGASGKGEKGGAGEGFGGPASSVNGPVKSGRSTGGQFINTGKSKK